MPQSPQDLAALDPEAETLSLVADLRLLAEEAKTLAQAELAFQKSRAAYAAAQTRNIALLLIVAAVLVFFAVMAAVVGTVIALGPWLGPWGAIAVVTLALLVIAFTAALSARSRASRMMAIISDSGRS